MTPIAKIVLSVLFPTLSKFRKLLTPIPGLRDTASWHQWAEAVQYDALPGDRRILEWVHDASVTRFDDGCDVGGEG